MIHVLVVDDDQDNRDLIAMALDLDPDMAVQSFPSGLAALAAIAGGKRYDVCLSDLRMQHMDGIALHRNIRNFPGTATMPTVLITATNCRDQTETFRDAHIAGVIQKPFNPMDLAAILRGYVREGMATNRPPHAAYASRRAHQ